MWARKAHPEMITRRHAHTVLADRSLGKGLVRPGLVHENETEAPLVWGAGADRGRLSMDEVPEQGGLVPTPSDDASLSLVDAQHPRRKPLRFGASGQGGGRARTESRRRGAVDTHGKDLQEIPLRGLSRHRGGAGTTTREPAPRGRDG